MAVRTEAAGFWPAEVDGALSGPDQSTGRRWDAGYREWPTTGREIRPDPAQVITLRLTPCCGLPIRMSQVGQAIAANGASHLMRKTHKLNWAHRAGSTAAGENPPTF